MTNRNVERLLNDLATVVPAVLADAGFKADSCILATRIALHVLQEYEVPAQAQPMQLTAMNAVYAQMAQETSVTRTSTPAEALEEIARLWAERGAWAVTIGNGADPRATRPGYDGHLIALVKRRWLLDLTCGQASRPAKGIPVPTSLFVELPRENVDERRPFLGGLGDGAKLVYVWHDNDTYLRAPDWTMVRPNDVLVRAVLDRLRGVGWAAAA